MMSRVSTALLLAVVLAGAAEAAPVVSTQSQCDGELANVAAMRKIAAVGPKTKLQLDGLIQAGAEHCAKGDYAQADSVFARLRGMMANE